MTNICFLFLLQRRPKLIKIAQRESRLSAKTDFVKYVPRRSSPWSEQILVLSKKKYKGRIWYRKKKDLPISLTHFKIFSGTNIYLLSPIALTLLRDRYREYVLAKFSISFMIFYNKNVCVSHYHIIRASHIHFHNSYRCGYV